MLFRYKLVIYVSLYIVIAVQFVFMLTEVWDQFENDLNIFSYFVVCVKEISVLSLRLSVLYLSLIFNTFYKLLSQFDKGRLCKYVIVILFSLVFVFCILCGTGLAIWKFSEHELDTRVERNFIEIKESRRFDENETRTSQSVIEEYRYREEDIAFTCEEDTSGFKGGNNYIEVIWKRNGKLLPSLRRYQQELIITPLPYDVYNYTPEWLPENFPPFPIFKVTATLKIYQVKFYDFGNYTCHIVHFIGILRRSKRMAGEDKISFSGYKRFEDLTLPIDRIKRNFVAEIKVDDDFVMLAGIKIINSSREFRFIEIPRKQTVISVPPGAILTFKTRYLHLSESNEDVSAEYFINGQPAEMSLCPDIFHGCSKLFLLHLYLTYSFPKIPPFVANLEMIPPFKRMKSPWYFLCVCENTYGYHNVYYLRRFYNSSAGKYEVLEVRHPHQLVVLPRGQDMLSLFQNRTSHNNGNYLKPPSPQDMNYVNMAATAVVNEFYLWETIVISIGFYVFLLTLLCSCLFLKCVEKYARRFLLNQPLPWLKLRDTDRREDLEDAKTKFSNQHFDIFISHMYWNSNLITDQILPVLHGHGQRVCTSELDIPPNLPTPLAVSTAIDNSARCIIIWSSEYKNDEFKLNMEVEMICDKSVYSKKFCKSPLLIIKLDGYPLLPWMRSFKVHYWTTTLSREDHLRRLSRWVQKGVKRDTKLSLCKQSTF